MGGASEDGHAQLRETLRRVGLGGQEAAVQALALPSIRLSPCVIRATLRAAPAVEAEVEVPVLPDALRGGLAAIAAGAFHCLGLTLQGGVVAWGFNDSGQLGDGTRLSRASPVDVVGLTGGVVAVAVSSFESLALRDDGSVVAWGQSVATTPVQVDGLAGARAIAVGLALLDDGSVLSWGHGTHGQLGDGGQPVSQNRRNNPAPVVGLPLPAMAISSSGEHCLALLEDGSVMAWGFNDHGQLGTGEWSDPSAPPYVRVSTTPTPVIGLAGGVAGIVAAGDNSFALREDGTVVAWGLNRWGSLGDGTTDERSSPVEVAGIGGPVRALASSWTHCLALRKDGVLVAWGQNHWGELGDGTAVDRVSPIIATELATGGGEVSTIAAGYHSSFAFLPDRPVQAWGKGLSVKRPEIGLTTDHALPLGGTRLGGAPDLPAGTEWPTLRDRSLAFIAQVDLAEVSGADTASVLPSAGLLSFFLALDHPHEPDRANPGGLVMLSEPGPLSRAEFPDDLAPSDRYDVLTLSVESDLTIPPWADPRLASERFVGDDSNAHWNLLLDRDEAQVHRMLGHPNAVQPSQYMPDICDQAFDKVNDGDIARDWMLLAQFDGRGDDGRVFYWIQRQDLVDRSFERAWVITQSH